MAATVDGRLVPFLTRNAAGKGQVVVLNVRTFSESDFGEGREWLLAPRRLGLSAIPQPLADTVRATLLSPIGVDFRAPAGVGLVLIGKAACAYSFKDEPMRVELGRRTVELPAHQLAWLP